MIKGLWTQCVGPVALPGWTDADVRAISLMKDGPGMEVSGASSSSGPSFWRCWSGSSFWSAGSGRACRLQRHVVSDHGPILTTYNGFYCFLQPAFNKYFTFLICIGMQKNAVLIWRHKYTHKQRKWTKWRKKNDSLVQIDHCESKMCNKEKNWVLCKTSKQVVFIQCGTMAVTCAARIPSVNWLLKKKRCRNSISFSGHFESNSVHTLFLPPQEENLLCGHLAETLPRPCSHSWQWLDPATKTHNRD